MNEINNQVTAQATAQGRIESTLGNKLLRSILAIYFIFAISLTCIQIYLEFSNEKDALAEEIMRVGKTFQPIFSQAIWSLNTEQINSNVRGVMENDNVVGVQIKDENGRVLSALGFTKDTQENIVTPDQNKKQNIPLSGFSKEINYQQRIISELYEFSSPILFNSATRGQQNIGTLYLYSSSDIVIDEAGYAIRITIINAVIKTLLLWLIASWVIRREVALPLSSLTSAMNELTPTFLKKPGLDRQTDQLVPQRAEPRGKPTNASENELDQMITTFFAMRKTILEKTAALFSAQEIALENLKKYAELFEQSNEGLFHYDIKQQTIKYNSALALLWGFDDKKDNQPLDEVLLIAKNSELYAVLSANNGNLVGYEYQHQHPHSLDHLWLSISMHLVRDEQDEPALIDGSIIDITQTKLKEKAERERAIAEAETKSKSEFIANMSHEIRTPLNGVLGMVQLLHNTSLNEQQRHYVKNIKSSGSVLLQVINDILDYSKIEVGKLSIETVEFNLYELIDESAGLFEAIAQESAVEFNVAIEKNVPRYVVSDPLRIRQILLNYLANAFKFTSQGSVLLRISCDNGVVSSVQSENSAIECLRLEVTDTGIGLTAEQQTKLFQSFSQADASTTRRFGGTGLGLAICHRLAELMQGGVGVSSVYDEGSTFWCVLPLGKAHSLEQSATIKINSQASDRITGKKILIVDDIAINLEVCQGLVEEEGHNAECCQTVAQLFAQLDAMSDDQPFDAILMDIHMPDMDGIAATLQIRRSKRMAIRLIPILALTADVSPETRQLCIESGIEEILPKPLSRQKIRAVFHKLFAVPGSDDIQATAISNSSPRSKDHQTNAADYLNQMILEEHLSALGKTRVIELIERLGKSLSEKYLQLHASLAENNLPHVANIAHGLVGMAQLFGLVKLADLSNDLEEKAKQGNLSAVLSLWQDLQPCCEHTLLVLKDYRTGIETSEN